jgi:hypothetical protein
VEPKSTNAPGTKLLPLIVTSVAPVIVAGETEATVGTGFSSVTVAVANAAGVAVLVAVMVTELTLGMVAGGV